MTAGRQDDCVVRRA